MAPAGLDAMVVSLYAKGLTAGDITAHLEDIYVEAVTRLLRRSLLAS